MVRALGGTTETGRREEEGGRKKVAFLSYVNGQPKGISCELVHEEKPFLFDGMRGGAHHGRRHAPPISFTTCILRRMLTANVLVPQREVLAGSWEEHVGKVISKSLQSQGGLIAHKESRSRVLCRMEPRCFAEALTERYQRPLCLSQL